MRTLMAAVQPRTWLFGSGRNGVTSRALATLIVLILVQLVVAQSLGLFPQVPMIDFYQYWGVSAALRLSGEPLGSPYPNHEKYHAVLRDHAARSDQRKLEMVSRLSARPSFTATPFLYVLFAAFPTDYTRAAALFHALQVLLFLGAVILLGAVYRYQVFPLLCLAFLLVLGSGPLSSDLRLGNLGCFQLVSLTVLLALVDRLRRAPSPTALGAIVLASLTLLALAKPNVGLVVAIMALHLWLAHGSRFFAIAAVPALLAGAAAVIIPCVYFGSWMVWPEWYRAVFGSNPYALARPPHAGNYSTARVLSTWLHADVWTVAALVAAALVISIIAVTAGSAKAEARAHATPPRGTLARLFGDPHLAMAIGVTMTIALPHLFWYHYYLIALIPGLWLLNASSGPSYLPLCGLGALVLSSGQLNVLFLPLGWTGAVAAGAALSWVPLWGGILVRLYSTGAPETGAVSMPSAAEKPDEHRAAETRPGQRPPRIKTPRADSGGP